MIDIDELRGLLARATPGPWQHKYERGAGFAQVWSENATDMRQPPNPAYMPGNVADGDDDAPMCFDCGWQPNCADDAALIAAARNALPTLLDELAALREEGKACRTNNYTLQTGMAELVTENAHLREREKALVEGLRQIMELPGEINPSNYDEDDVIALNNSHCEAYQIARALIGDQA